jgi:hypothetical protein
VWDADTPQVDVGTTEDDVDIINLDESKIMPVVPEDVRKLPKEKRNKKRKTSGSARPADAAEDNGRPGGMANMAETTTVHSAEDDAVLATTVASIQEPTEPLPGTDEVHQTDGVEPVVETVDAPTPMIGDNKLEEQSVRMNVKV